MIIAIISPIRFKKEMMAEYVAQSYAGNIVLLPVDEKEYPMHEELTEKEEAFMALHKKKIAMADKVLVMNVNGYMGRGTYEEIGYATVLGKPIEYYNPIAILTKRV